MQEEGQKRDDDQTPSGWKFKPGEKPVGTEMNSVKAALGASNSSSGNLIEWSASEYIGNPKTSSWFAMFSAGAVALAVIIFIITNDYVSTFAIVILGVIVGVFAARQPSVLEYSLDMTGIHMGSRFYPYNTFKSFSVVDEGAFSHISLLPLKRFMPNLAVHYSPADEQKITAILANYLPFSEQKRDMIENFSRRVRF